MTESRLIVALDTTDAARAAGWAAAVAPYCGLFKLGLEFFLANGAAGDQARTMTPEEAVAAGADWIVVGRPVTAAPDAGQAAAAIAAAIR